MPTTSGVHVVCGAGQIGPLLARRLVADGKKVRLVRRSAAPVRLDGVEAIQADATDPAAMLAAAEGASVLYHCMNPAYSATEWASVLPAFQASLIQAAARTGARLVVLDNVYMLGRPDGRPFTESTPLAPCSRKGEIRARLHEELTAAVKRGDVRAVKGHASDFYGPRGVGTNFADRFWIPALAGKTASFVVNPDTLHTYHFIPDVAAGLAALGSDPEAEGTFMLPCVPAGTTRQLVDRLASALGRTIRTSRIPGLVLKLLSLGMPILREVNEMAYQWEASFVVDDSKFRARYGDLATPPDEAARLTVEWARSTFGRP